MGKILVLPIVFVSIFLVLFSIPDAHATDYELQTGDANNACETLGGSWDGNATCTVKGFALNSGDTLEIDSGVKLYNGGGTITNSGTITNDGAVFNISISDNIANSGIITNHRSGTIYNDESITNTGTINNNQGNIDNSNNIINYRIITNAGTINNSGTLTNQFGGDITVDYGTITNSGTIDNYAHITIYSFGTMTNYSGGTIDNSGTITNGGTITNNEIIFNTGTINNNSGTIVNNNNIKNEVGTIANNYGTIVNYHTITNLGTIVNKDSANIKNHGTIDNSLTLKNDCSATVDTSTGKISNSGIIDNNATYSTPPGPEPTNFIGEKNVSPTPVQDIPCNTSTVTPSPGPGVPVEPLTGGILEHGKTSPSGTSTQQSYLIPGWVKNNAKWWSHGQTSDSDFASGIGYLVSNGIITTNTKGLEGLTTVVPANMQIPSWIKNSAGWWADGTITDYDFLKGIQFMLDNNIITFANPKPSHQENQNQGASPQGTVTQSAYDISIKILDKTTGQPVDAMVTVTTYSNPITQETDRDGIAHFTISAGDYEVQVDSNNYQRLNENLAVTGNIQQTLQLEPMGQGSTGESSTQTTPQTQTPQSSQSSTQTQLQITASPTAASFVHNIGQTQCPEPITTVSLSSNLQGAWSLASYPSWASVSLQGNSATVQFNCQLSEYVSQTLSGNVVFQFTSSDGQTQSVTVSVTGQVNGS